MLRIEMRGVEVVIGANNIKSIEEAEHIADEMMVAELNHHYSTMTLGEEIQILDAKEELKTLRKKVLGFDLEQSIQSHDPREAFEYLEVAYKIQQLSEKLGSLHFSGDSKERNQLLDCANDLFEMAMLRLEEEFVYLLNHYKQPLEPERLSFHSIEDDGVDFSGSSFGEEPIEGKAAQSDVYAGSEDFVVDLIEPGALSTLKSIANFMFLSNYDKECCQAYVSARQVAMDEYLTALCFDKFSIEELMSINWNTLSKLIKRWNRAVKVYVRVYLTSERRLGNLVFGGLPGPTAELCFPEISKSSVMQVLNFAEAVAIGPPKPEKLFRILDMYEVLDDLIPEIESLFPAGHDNIILTECHEVLLQLAESVRRTFKEFKYAIQSYTSSVAFARGGVHPLAKYVMNYIRALAAYSKTLDSLLKDRDGKDQYLSSEVDSTRSAYSHFTTTALHLLSVTARLELNLEVRSRLYKDEALQNFFMMNNICYMVQKVKDSDLKKFLGDNWIRVHNRKFQKHAMSYERTSWSQVLSFLSEEGQAPAGHGVSLRSAIKERFKGFNQSFEEAYRVQTAWIVPHVQLRDDLRISISLKVLQAYRTFVGRYAGRLDGMRHRDRYLKYSPDDLEKFLLDLFEGSPKSLQLAHRG